MTRYIIRRSLQSVVLLWLATLIGFTVYQLAPGGPLQFLDENPQASQQDFERLERSYGIDRTIPVQYIAWLLGEDWLPKTDFWRAGRCLLDESRCSRGIVRMDFGRSFSIGNRPAIDVIAERIPATFLLGASSLFFSILIGVPLGIISALTRGRWPDNLIRVTTVFLNTLPDWYIGLVLLIILGGYLRIVPLGGMQTIGDGSLLDRLHHLILPALVSATGGWIGFSRILRFEMLDVLHQDYVRTAYAKGLSRNAVIIRHVCDRAGRDLSAHPFRFAAV
jgi:peptide/nickel transport system permease protein